MFDFGGFISNHKSGILTGFGLGLCAMASVTAAKYSPYAIRALEEKHEENDDLPVKDMVKTVIPYVLPTGLFFMLGSVCIVKAADIHIKKGYIYHIFWYFIKICFVCQSFIKEIHGSCLD